MKEPFFPMPKGNPQPEDGTVRIATELWEALTAIRIPGEAMQCLLFILRKTYGWNKKKDAISNSQFVEATGISKWHVDRAIQKLIDIKIVTKKGGGKASIYAVNKQYHTWKKLPRKVTVTQNGGKLPRKVTKLPKKEDTKDTNKRHLTIDSTINLRQETKDLYTWIDNRCDEFDIKNLVKKKTLDVYVNKYIGKIKLRVELDSYLIWMFDTNRKVLRSAAVGNCFKRELAHQKKQALKQQQKWHDEKTTPPPKDFKIDPKLKAQLTSQSKS